MVISIGCLKLQPVHFHISHVVPPPPIIVIIIIFNNNIIISNIIIVIVVFMIIIITIRDYVNLHAVTAAHLQTSRLEEVQSQYQHTTRQRIRMCRFV